MPKARRFFLQGWRVMFFVVAAFALVAAAAVFLGGVEPRKLGGDRRGTAGVTSVALAIWQGLVMIFSATRTVFRIRSAPHVFDLLPRNSMLK